MQALVKPGPSRLWYAVDAFMILATLVVAVLVMRQAFVMMPWSISHAFALDNPLPVVISAVEKFERIASFGISASLFLLGYGLIRRMMSSRVSLVPFIVVAAVLMSLVFSSVVTWRMSPALSWTRPDSEEVARQMWSAYSWSSSQSTSLPAWVGDQSQEWRMPGGIVATVSTLGDMAKVSVPVSPGLSCQHLLDELSNQSLPPGSELRVGNRRMEDEGYEDACRGDKMKQVLLVSQKWPEQS